MKRRAFTFVKLLLAGATVFGIGSLLVVRGINGDIAEAEADISTFTTTQALYDGNYGKVVESSGLKPRPYEMNGNQVFFAVGYVKESPQDVLEFYQEKFVEAGINERKFMEVPEGKFNRTIGDLANKPRLSEDELAYNRALLTGGVVPISERPGYVAMGGMVPKGAYNNDLDEIIADWSANEGDVDRPMGGFRFIDAQQWPNQIGSRVTSVWADEGFDAAKMNDPAKNAGPPVLETPVCIGCAVGMQMRSLDKSERYRIGHFYATRGKSDVVSFYDKAMLGRGFESGDAHKAIEYARNYLGTEVPDGNILQFKKGGTESLIAIFDDPRTLETSVVVVEQF